MMSETDRIHTHDIIQAWEEYRGDDVTAFYAEWDAKLEQLHRIQRGEQPHMLVEFTIEDALGMQQALDEWNADHSDDNADALADHLQAVLEKMK